jgi:tetratricopeptide (TPR) repeat protein
MIRLGSFQLNKQIGQGGTGEVWTATHPGARRPVAVKVLSAEALRDAVYRAAFRNEVRAVAGLRHPHVIRVFDHGEVTESEASQAEFLVPGMSYLAMELADGGSLAARRGKLSWVEVRAVLLALLDALAHAHARGVVHRDLKPGNVLLGKSQPRIKLTDFGLAHALDRQFPWEASTTAGTPSYMAPEQFVGEWRDFGPWTDLYALACLGWALVSGRPPFRASGRMEAMQAHLGQEPPALHSRVPVPDGFEAWLRRLLEKDLKYRFQSAADGAWALLQLPDPPRGGTRFVGDPPVRWLPRALQRTTLSWPEPIEGAHPPLTTEWRRPDAAASPTPLGTGLGLFGLRSIPMVDREQERDVLWHALSRVQEERGPVAVLLRGLPGCGKSRLGQWMARRASELGIVTSMVLTHSPHDAGREGMERLVARRFHATGLAREQVRYRVQVALSSWGGPDPEEEEALTDLIVPSARDGEDGGDRSVGSVRRHAVVRKFLERLASNRAVVLLVEDVQWGAEALEFIHDVLARGAPPVLFVVTWREDFAGLEESASLVEAIRRSDRSVDLPVGPLDAESGRKLVGELLGVEPDLADQVAARAEGNPLFAVQLVTDWVDRGVLVAGPRGFRLRSDMKLQLPDDLHQVWMDRLHQVLSTADPEARVALEIAAALGLEVDRGEWEEACAEAGVEAPAALVERLLDQRLAVAHEEEDRWSFAHGMLRESVERLAREGGRLQSHHHCCASMLRRQGRVQEPERLGRHLLLAGEAEAAVEQLLAGVRRWLRVGDSGAAIALLEEIDRAIATAALPGPDRRRVEAWVLRARVEAMRGHHKQGARWARIAASIAEQYDFPDLRSRALLNLGWAFHTLGHPVEADAFLSEARELAEVWGDAELLAEALTRWGEVWCFRGDADRATACFERALELHGGESSGAGQCWIGLGSVAVLRGYSVAAAAFFERARTLYKTSGESRGLASALGGLAVVARHTGRIEEAEGLSREAMDLCARYDLAQTTRARVDLALVLLAADRVDEAYPILRQCMVELQAQGWRGMVAVTRAALLMGAGRRGDWLVWDQHLLASVELVAAVQLRAPDIPWLYELAARDAEAAGEGGRARQAWEFAVQQWEGLGRAAEAKAVVRMLESRGVR